MKKTNTLIEKIVVSRKWNSPNIELFLDSDEIGIKISVVDFLDALVIEVGNPTLLVTKNALRLKLEDATNKIVAEMKNQTVNL